MEKPYQWSYCDKAFSDNTKLANQLKVQSGNKPYQCNVCDKTFSYNSNFINQLIDMKTSNEASTILALTHF